MCGTPTTRTAFTDLGCASAVGCATRGSTGSYAAACFAIALAIVSWPLAEPPPAPAPALAPASRLVSTFAEFFTSFLRYSRVLAAFASLSVRIAVTRGNRIEIPPAVWCSEVENSAPVISLQRIPPRQPSRSPRTRTHQTGAAQGSATTRSGTKLECTESQWGGLPPTGIGIVFNSLLIQARVASSCPFPHLHTCGARVNAHAAAHAKRIAPSSKRAPPHRSTP